MVTDDKIGITGDLYIALYDANGNLKDDRSIKNMVVDTGKELIAALIAGSTNKPNYIGLGTDNTPTGSDHTVLSAEVGARFAFNTATSTDNIATFTASLNPGVGTGSYSEAGIFDTLTGGIMLARTTFNIITKTSVDKLVITWNIRVN